MIPLRTQIDGLGPLRDIDINWEEFGSGVIIGLEGPVASGKTTLMEACSLGQSLRMGYYDGNSIWDHVGPRSFYMKQVTRIGEHEITTELKAGAGGKNRRSTISVDGGTPIGPKQGEYLAEVAKWMPSRDELLIANYTAQNAVGDLFKLPRAQRIEVFTKMFRLWRWKTWGLEAGRKAKAAGENASFAARALEQAREFDSQRVALGAGLTQEKTDAVVLEKERKVAAERQAELTPLILRESTRIAQATRDRDAANKAYSEAVAAKATLDREIEMMEAQIRQLTPAEEIDADALSRRLGAIREALAPLRELSTESNRLYQAAAEAEVAAGNEVSRLEGFLSRAVAEKTAEVKALQAEILGHKRLASAIEGVDIAHPMCAKCPLTAEGGAALGALAQAEAALGGVEASLALSKENINSDIEVAKLEHEAAKGKSVAAAQAWSDIGTQVRDLEAEQREIGEKIAAASARDQQRSTRDQIRGTLNAKMEQRDRAAVAVSRAEAAARAVRIDSKLLIDLEAESSVIDTTLESCRIRGIQMERRISEAETKLNSLGDTAKLLAAAEQAFAETSAAAGQWRTVSVACDHVRSVEMDCIARPATEIATNILSVLDGGRLEVHLVTQTEGAEGQAKEDFCPVLIDRSAEAAVRSQGSGGETSFASEAMRSAIGIVLAQMGHRTVQTAWRDEASTGQDDFSQEVYIAILRDLIKRASLNQVWLTAHQDIIRRTDRQIRLEQGRIVRIS